VLSISGSAMVAAIRIRPTKPRQLQALAGLQGALQGAQQRVVLALPQHAYQPSCAESNQETSHRKTDCVQSLLSIRW
jgi:hypothetical protein